MLRNKLIAPVVISMSLLSSINVSAFEQTWAVPLGMEHFMQLIEKQNNELLGLEVFQEAVEYAEKTKAILAELSQSAVPEISNLLFVGDSRVVGMSTTGMYSYLGKESIGYNWFVSDGAAQMLDMAGEGSDVVLCFGVNDLGNISQYIGYYQSLINNHPSIRFWIMSVNPVNEGLAASCGYSVTNSMITSFNDAMYHAFPDKYLDCYAYLSQNGFGSSDGVHYDSNTYTAIQNFTKSTIEQKIQ